MRVITFFRVPALSGLATSPRVELGDWTDRELLSCDSDSDSRKRV